MVKKFGFKYKDKKFEIDVIECKNIISKGTGLMFKKKSKPLLFQFQMPGKRAIHSFFCKPFIAVWFLKNQIIDVKYIDNWKMSIKPEKKFDKLLEIPMMSNFFKEFYRRYRNL